MIGNLGLGLGGLGLVPDAGSRWIGRVDEIHPLGQSFWSMVGWIPQLSGNHRMKQGSGWCLGSLDRIFQ